MNFVDFNVQGIKCDACDYKDETVKFEDYKDYINKPCPQCGANLLTEADVDTLLKTIQSVDFINTILKPFVKVDKNTPRITLPCEMNGTGILKINN